MKRSDTRSRTSMPSILNWRCFLTEPGHLMMNRRRKFISSSIAAFQLNRWRRTSAVRERAFIASSTKCVLAGSWNFRWTFVPHSSFPRLNPQRVLAEQFRQRNGTPRKSRVPSGLPAYLNSLYETPLLTRQQEAFLFRQV